MRSSALEGTPTVFGRPAPARTAPRRPVFPKGITMSISELTASELAEAKRMRDTLADAGVAAGLDQIAAAFGTAAEFCAGRITRAQLRQRTGWSEVQRSVRVEPPTDPAAAAVFWAERRPVFAEVGGVRVVRCEQHWIIRLLAARNDADLARWSAIAPEGGGGTVWLTGAYWDLDGTGPHRPGAPVPRDDYRLVFAEFGPAAPTYPLR